MSWTVFFLLSILGVVLLIIARLIDAKTAHKAVNNVVVFGVGALSLALIMVGAFGTLIALAHEERAEAIRNGDADGSHGVVDVLFGGGEKRFEALEERYDVTINERGYWSKNPSKWMIDDVWRECYVVEHDDAARLMCDVYIPGEARYAELGTETDDESSIDLTGEPTPVIIED